MSNKTLRTGDYLGHILQAIARIQRYTTGLTAGTPVPSFALTHLL